MAQVLSFQRTAAASIRLPEAYKYMARRDKIKTSKGRKKPFKVRRCQVFLIRICGCADRAPVRSVRVVDTRMPVDFRRTFLTTLQETTRIFPLSAKGQIKRAYVHKQSL